MSAERTQEPLHSIRFTEPRIELIKRQLESILQLVELEKDGQVAQVDGFRLKNLADWIDSEPNSIYDNLGSFSTCCNCHCELCYEEAVRDYLGEPRAMLSVEETLTRIKYFDAERHKGLFRVQAHTYEPFCNPQFLHILELARQAQPQQVFRIPTNGGFLTEEVVKRLADLMPLHVTVHLGSVNAATRRRLMKDRLAETAIESPRLLSEYGVAFSGINLIHPTLELGDVEETIRYFASQGGDFIRLMLPAYTKYNPPQSAYTIEELYPRIIDFVRKVRPTVDIPILVYWEDLEDQERCMVYGICKHSPARQTDLRLFDEVVAINGVKVLSRPHAAYLLSPEKNRAPEVSLTVRRNQQVLTVTLANRRERVCMLKNTLGVYIPHGLSRVYVKVLQETIHEYDARQVLILSSRFTAPVIRQFVSQYERYFGGASIWVEAPENRFWGGNIFSGGLLMVSDYVACIDDFIRRTGIRPDLLLIPDTFVSGWGRDWTGTPYTRIERQFGIPVALLQGPR